MVVVDGHCRIEDDRFLEKVAAAFEKSDADCLGRPQPLDLAGASPLQRAVAAARSCWLGHHPDSFIYSSEERYVPAKSVAVAYRRSVFDKTGYFDESFDACEDVELNHRIDKAGLRCYFTPQIAVHYSPRSSIGGLFRQMVRYGRGRVRLSRKHPETFSVRCCLPAFLLIGCVAGAVLSWVSSWTALIFVAALAIYGITLITTSATIVGRLRYRTYSSMVARGLPDNPRREWRGGVFGGNLHYSANPHEAGAPGSAMSSTQRIKSGIVGAGEISESHVRGLQRLPYVDIVGVADTNEDRAKALAERFGLPGVFPNLAGLLEAQPDVVHVLTPPATHADIACEAIRGGCHVLVEKPLATSVEDCDRIAAAAEEAGKKVCVGHSMLRDPFVVRALEVVQSGAIGSVVGVDHFRRHFYTPYAGGPLPYRFHDGGFPFRDLGVHSLYLIEAFLGPIRQATLELGPPSHDGCPVYKEWRVCLPCERGIGQVYLSCGAFPLQDMLIVHGTRGVMRVDIMGMSVTTRCKTRLPGPAERILNTASEGRRMMTQVTGNVWKVLRKKLLRYHGLQMIVGEFYEALRNGQAPPVTIEDARPIVRWTEQVARQADEAKHAYLAQFATGGSAKTLVTGATGFIGKHLLQRLLAKRGRVRILVRHDPGNGLLHDDRIEVFHGNLGSPNDVDRAVEGISEVFHLGATVEGWEEDFQCATIAGTRNVIESALKHDAKLIYMSSLSVIHAAAACNGKKITEDWPLEPHPTSRGLYSQTKLQAEQLVTDAVRQRGLQAIVLRPGEVVGPDRPFLSGAVAIDTARRLVVLGNGRFTLPLIWVEDLVDAIVAAADSDHFDGTVLHLVDPTALSQDEIAKYYLGTTGRRKRIVHAPLSLLYLAAFSANTVFRLIGRNAPLTPYRLRSAIGSRSFDCSAAANTLGWRPQVGVREGLRRMAHSTD